MGVLVSVFVLGIRFLGCLGRGREGRFWGKGSY